VVLTVKSVVTMAKSMDTMSRNRWSRCRETSGHHRAKFAITQLEPFWEHSTHLQLQYSQLVLLIFNNILWPHVTVATMTLSAG
jgi:hypothetical protein